LRLCSFVVGFPGNKRRASNVYPIMLKLLLFCLLFIFCWPLAVAALVLYPIVWLLLLPFRIVGIAVDGALELIRALFMLPVRVLRAI
jgi:hypothetical protein